MDPLLYNDQMTLKPTQKIRRKNKRTKLQDLYEEGKVTSEEFYHELVRFIKSRLMPDLIRRGYYKRLVYLIKGIRSNRATRPQRYCLHRFRPKRHYLCKW